MILIVGLGNPEKKYQGTRHNIGFAVLDALSENIGANFTYDKKSNSDIAPGILNNKEIILMKPQTYMNKSGDAIASYFSFYKIVLDKIIIFHDELDLPFGEIRIARSSGSAGNKGIESILKNLPINDLTRIRIGIANKKLDFARALTPKFAKDNAVGDFVLSRFTFTERLKIKRVILEAIEMLSKELA